MGETWNVVGETVVISRSRRSGRMRRFGYVTGAGVNMAGKNGEKDIRHGCMGMVLGNTWLEVREDLGVQLEGQLSSGRGGSTVGLMRVDMMRVLKMAGSGSSAMGDTWVVVGDLGCDWRDSCHQGEEEVRRG